MRSRCRLLPCLAVTIVGLAFGSLALAQGLPRLPADLTLPQAKDSPGKVVFSHATHVDQAKPECTTCHPKMFKLVNPQLARGAERLVHAKMEKGAQCGSCHNGKDARGFDDCTMCHRSQ
jgi:c(7)-type cytochrome triheme protein